MPRSQVRGQGHVEGTARVEAGVLDIVLGTGGLDALEILGQSRQEGLAHTLRCGDDLGAGLRVGEAHRAPVVEVELPGAEDVEQDDLVTVEAQELPTNESIVSAAHEFRPLIARTEIWNKNRELKAVIEYPVKTINTMVTQDSDRFDETFERYRPHPAMDATGQPCVHQVDTGPVAYTDLEMDCRQPEERIFLAYVAFNIPDVVDFVVIQETPIIRDGREVTRAHYFSKYVHLPAKNRVFAVI